MAKLPIPNANMFAQVKCAEDEAKEIDTTGDLLAPIRRLPRLDELLLDSYCKQDHKSTNRAVTNRPQQTWSVFVEMFIVFKRTYLHGTWMGAPVINLNKVPGFDSGRTKLGKDEHNAPTEIVLEQRTMVGTCGWPAKVEFSLLPFANNAIIGRIHNACKAADRLLEAALL